MASLKQVLEMKNHLIHQQEKRIIELEKLVSSLCIWVCFRNGMESTESSRELGYIMPNTILLCNMVVGSNGDNEIKNMQHHLGKSAKQQQPQDMLLLCHRSVQGSWLWLHLRTLCHLPSQLLTAWAYPVSSSWASGIWGAASNWGCSSLSFPWPSILPISSCLIPPNQF